MTLPPLGGGEEGGGALSEGGGEVVVVGGGEVVVLGGGEVPVPTYLPEESYPP